MSSAADEIGNEVNEQFSNLIPVNQIVYQSMVLENKGYSTELCLKLAVIQLVELLRGIAAVASQVPDETT